MLAAAAGNPAPEASAGRPLVARFLEIGFDRAAGTLQDGAIAATSAARSAFDAGHGAPEAAMMGLVIAGLAGAAMLAVAYFVERAWPIAGDGEEDWLDRNAW